MRDELRKKGKRRRKERDKKWNIEGGLEKRMMVMEEEEEMGKDVGLKGKREGEERDGRETEERGSVKGDERKETKRERK